MVSIKKHNPKDIQDVVDTLEFSETGQVINKQKPNDEINRLKSRLEAIKESLMTDEEITAREEITDAKGNHLTMREVITEQRTRIQKAIDGK